MNPTQHAEPTPEFFLEAARRIGRRLVETALPQGDGKLTWEIMTPDRERPAERRAIAALAGSTLYEGTSGIGLFLAELHAATGDETLLPAIEGAFAHALADAQELPDSSFGLHGGRVGVAYAAARAGTLLGRQEWVRAAEALLLPMVGHETEDRGIDVIGGAGGAIPALLRMAEWLPDAELATGLARRLGDNLLVTAEKEQAGWSWGALKSSSVRNLCGYAHGAAGMGHALLELYAATGEAAYLYGAEQAYLYERHFFSAESNNWPDLRHGELGEYFYSGRLDELKARILGGEPLPPQPMRYMSAWCHGAPGIGLTRIRAWELLKDPMYLEEARAALASSAASLEDVRNNYSLCHGQGGNAETLILAADVLGEPEWRRAAERCALAGWEEYEAQGRPWPCGTLGAVSDPGLLLGEAGIGYFFLRLARPETPSVLLINGPGSTAAASGEGFREWQRTWVEEHFGRTLAAFRALGEDVEALVAPRDFGGAPVRSDVEGAAAAIERRVSGEGDAAHRELLEDAFRLDRERWALAESVTDFTREFLEGLTRQDEEEVRWQEARFELSPRVRVVHSHHDWDAWLGREDGDAGPPPPEDVFHLVVASGNRASARRLSPFAAIVLSGLETPATLDEVVSTVEEAVSGGATREWLEDRVVEQLRQAYRAGLVGVESGLVGAGAA